jgi:hypothetical protein
MSKYVSLFLDLLYASWPQRAEEEYIRQHGQEAFNNMDAGEAALWLGTWLHEHKGEIPAVTDYPEYDIKLGDIYRYEGDALFFWLEKDPDGTGNTCKVRIEEIPDDAVWAIDSDSEYCVEFVNVYHKPDANGLLRYMTEAEKRKKLEGE